MVSFFAFPGIVGFVLASLVSVQTSPPPTRPPPPTPQPYPTPKSVQAPNKATGPYVPPPGPYPDGPVYGSASGRYLKPPSFPSFPVSSKDEVDELDRLFADLAALSIELDFSAETLSNLDSQQSLQKKLVTQLTLLDLPDLEQENVVRGQMLDKLEQKLLDLDDLIGDLRANVEDLEYRNSENVQGVKDVKIALAKEQVVDSNQDRNISSLLAAVQNLKTQLTVISKMKFTVLDKEIEKLVGQLSSIQDLTSFESCETGVTTLTADDRRSTVVFNTDFGGNVPQIQYGITGFKSKFVGEKPSKSFQYGYGYGYGNAYDPRYPQYGSPSYSVGEPGTLGDIVLALATPESITLQLSNLGFNVAESVSVEVAWQACFMGPGTRLAKY
ncbi:uncharacterized protein LOC112562440 [Pomacea canaliculata]|uniref:uncharacterized protein LOC112562440 n=1 Tax=Pomacea canaliculata TaxID=400727 RepID=UPI000D7285E8|nr:uncharacterized protein LOC112562440 [Pomacea canaliculata]